MKTRIQVPSAKINIRRRRQMKCADSTPEGTAIKKEIAGLNTRPSARPSDSLELKQMIPKAAKETASHSTLIQSSITHYTNKIIHHNVTFDHQYIGH